MKKKIVIGALVALSIVALIGGFAMMKRSMMQAYVVRKCHHRPAI